MTKIGSCDRLVLHAGRALIERVKIPRVGKPLALGNVVVRYFVLYDRKKKTHLFTRPSKSELQEMHLFFSLSHFISSKASIYDPGWLPVRIAKTLVGKPSLSALKLIVETYGFEMEGFSDWDSLIRDNPSASHVGDYATGQRITARCVSKV